MGLYEKKDGRWGVAGGCIGGIVKLIGLFSFLYVFIKYPDIPGWLFFTAFFLFVLVIFIAGLLWGGDD